jgi:two-component system response regulator DevR
MDQTTRSPRVFVVDDHAVVREGLRWYVESSPDFTFAGAAGTVRDGLAGLLRGNVDVAVVDEVLPDGNGIGLIREVRSRRPRTQCVVFTSYPDDRALFGAIVAGAAGYIVKDAPREEVLAALRSVSRGEALIGPDLLDDLRRRRSAAVVEDELLRTLTAQERRILDMITEGSTNREIAARLRVGEKTIRNYVSTILAKMGMRNRTEVAVYATRLEARREARGHPSRANV